MKINAVLPEKGRDLRLDLFRGIANWAIFLDHIPDNVVNWITTRNWGFSDAADLFVFISGYTASFVYARMMIERGFIVGATRLTKRVWQLYVAHIILFVIYIASISYLAQRFGDSEIINEFNVAGLVDQATETLRQGLLLKFKPVNLDVLPLYIVLMLALPLILVLMRWRADLTLALSVLLYAATWQFDLYFSSYPNGVWMFNPLAWQLLFVFGAWCALGGARRMGKILSSNVTLWISIAYLIAAFFVTLTWYVPQLGQVLPRRLEQWMYPIDKTDLDVLRFAHFLALAAITVRFLPNDWPGLKSPWLKPLMLCGQHSLEIFCLGVFLAFAGHFILAEGAGGAALHALISLCGIFIMSSVAWLISWYKHSADKSAKKGARGNADLAGGG